jgi:RimJ/RimL family protein N-acetyltransferase
MESPDAVLVTSRLALTPLRPEDADAVFSLYADERMYVFTGDPTPTLEDLRARYRRLAVGRSDDGRQEWRNWIVRQRVDDEPVGVLQATIDDEGRHSLIAWDVGVAWQGRGYASEAAGAVMRWLEARGVVAVEAHVHPDHIASARVAAKIGLEVTDEMVDGEWVWRRAHGAGR